MNRKNQESNQKKQSWTLVIEKWKKSGLSATAYSRKEGYDYSRFTYWIRKLRSLNAPKLVAVSRSFSPDPEERREDLPIKLHFGTCHLEIPNGFDGSTLLRIMALLKQVT